MRENTFEAGVRPGPSWGSLQRSPTAEFGEAQRKEWGRKGDGNGAIPSNEGDGRPFLHSQRRRGLKKSRGTKLEFSNIQLQISDRGGYGCSTF